jgi:hypothetical protein
MPLMTDVHHCYVTPEPQKIRHMAHHIIRKQRWHGPNRMQRQTVSKRARFVWEKTINTYQYPFGMSDTVGIWIAIGAGVVATMGSCYGIYREWQQRRLNQITRLNDAATMAVRRTEAEFVRPILSERLSKTVQQFTTLYSPESDHLRFRALLFADLHGKVRLSVDEKAHAKLTATNHFIRILKSMPNPPIALHTARDEAQKNGTLIELIELAYGLRPRPSTELTQQLALFCGTDIMGPAAVQSRARRG